MHLTVLDWAIVAAYLTFALGVGFFYSRRAGTNAEEYYLAGRSLPWWVVGTSMVATTFAADTPLAITEMSRSKGIWENWFWWNWLLFGLLAVFLFARLWRRANVLTENEFFELRYSGKPAAFLRLFKAGYFALLYNFFVMGWVLKGMSSVLTVMLVDEPSLSIEFGRNVLLSSQDLMVWALAVVAVLYALLSGFWGVVITDVVQFLIAMAGAVVLAVLAVNHVGGIDSLMAKLDTTLAERHERLESSLKTHQAALASANQQQRTTAEAEVIQLQTALDQLPKSAQDAVRVVPPIPRGVPLLSRAFLNSPFFQFLVLVTVMWWSNHSTDGGGYLIQRTMAAKDERHAMAANLWYNFANFALRTWPWVLVALVSMVMIPDLSDHALGDKAGYPLVMQAVLGPGLRGLLLVSFLAAFMSTIDTHLNWASSYLVHDIYRRFLVRDRSERHYVLIGRVTTVLLMILAAIISMRMGSIEKAWKFVMAMGAGIGLVLILRWFWWRINAWTEISALATSVFVTAMFEVLAATQTLAAGDEYTLFGTEPVIGSMPVPFHLQLLVVVVVSIVVWSFVTFITQPEPHATLVSFYQRVQPGGWWQPISKHVETTMRPVTQDFLLNFIAGLAFIWGAMFFIGNLIFKQWIMAGLMLCMAIASFTWIWRRCIQSIE